VRRGVLALALVLVLALALLLALALALLLALVLGERCTFVYSVFVCAVLHHF